MASDAVSNERVSRITGYKIKKGDFRLQSPNLPQRIALLGEANDANQALLNTSAPVQILSAKQAGELYGYGSPIYHILRILKPISGDGVGGIPIFVYPQAKAAGAVAKQVRIIPAGTATKNGTHIIKISGRESIDGSSYAINIEAGDNVATICEKIVNAVNAVIGSPVTAIDYDYQVVAKAKWSGLTSNDLNIEVITEENNNVGVTYTVNTLAAGSGTPDIAAALSQFGSDWNTIVINSYGTVASVMTALENFNGIADSDNPTGRFRGTIMKPFIAITGTVADDPSSIFDARSSQMTIAGACAPGSKAFSFEAAANYTLLQAIRAQDKPHLDISGQSLPDMPAPSSIGSMATYDNRDAFVKKGCTTVDLVAGRYQIQDFVTTYHPSGENPPQFRYVRNIFLDLNVYYGYYLLQETNVRDKVIAADDDNVQQSEVIKPKNWKQLVKSYADDLAARALITQPDFMKDSIEVNLSSSNPDRLETFFRYKRSGIARIASTDAEAGFNFGSEN
ncbi:MAG: hypothetical protein EBW87_00175 [Burkholderiaceae bacterium]|nr:hypothetical protein [Burkholderiaceae bacterium]